MYPNTDYYRILGVLDDAEDIVIKAAYRALAQRYHPDRWKGQSAEANQRMAEINEAHAVLSDPTKRKQYDAQREERGFEPDPENKDAGETSDGEVDEKWRVACEYFPDLVSITNDLDRLSSSLAFTFKLTVLDTQGLNERCEVALKLENNYLRKYFGSNEKISRYAKNLILAGRKAAARELNKAVCVLGMKVDSAIIIRKIEEKYPVAFSANEQVKMALRLRLITLIKRGGFYGVDSTNVRKLASDYVSLIGGVLDIGKRVVPLFLFLTAEELVFKITQHGETKALNTQEFIDWVNNS